MRGDNEDSEQSVHNKTERSSPLNNTGRQSDSNVRRTLGHVEPTMRGVMTSIAQTLLTFRFVLTVDILPRGRQSACGHSSHASGSHRYQGVRVCSCSSV